MAAISCRCEKCCRGLPPKASSIMTRNSPKRTNSLGNKRLDLALVRTDGESEPLGDLKQQTRVLVRVLVRQLLNGDGDSILPLKNAKRFLKRRMNLAGNIVASNGTTTECKARLDLGVKDPLTEFTECFEVGTNLSRHTLPSDDGPLGYFYDYSVPRNRVGVLHECVELFDESGVTLRRALHTGRHTIAHAQPKGIASKPSSLGELPFRNERVSQQ
jgi:hypothetical protein